MGRSESSELVGPARWGVVSLALSMLLSSLGVSIPNVALPTLIGAFSASFHQVQWVVIAYLLAMTVSIVSAGRLGDVLGHRKVLLVGVFIFTVASAMCGAAPTLQTLIATRAAQGIGASMLMALTVALVRQTVPKERTGSAMGLLGTMSAIGTALGPSLGGLLVAGPGWRAIFLIMVPLGLLTFLMAQRHLPTPERGANPDRKGFDVPGTLLLGLSLAAYALAVTAGKGSRGLKDVNLVLLAAAAVGAGLFLLSQATVRSPLLRLGEFRNPILVASLAMNVLVATVMMSTLVVAPFYLSRGLGLDEALVGLVMAIGPVISTLSGVPAGKIVDRLGAARMVVIGLAQMTIGAFALSVLPAMYGIAGYVAAVVILTPGYQLFQAGNNTAVMMDVPQDQRGVISGMLSLARNIGLITGASVLGAVFAYASRASGDITKASAAAVNTGMGTTFTVGGVLLAIAFGMGVLSMRLSVRPSMAHSTST